MIHRLIRSLQFLTVASILASVGRTAESAGAPPPPQPVAVAPGATAAEKPTSDDVEAPPPAAGGERDEMRRPLNRQPILIHQEPPQYPKEFSGTGVEAEVILTMMVDREGRTSHVRVESSPDPLFTDAALDALARWEFLAGIRQGKYTNTPMQLNMQVREEIGDRVFFDYVGGQIALLGVKYAGDVKADTPMRRLYGLRPAYPFDMLVENKPGEVVLEFVVGEDGAPRHFTIVSATHKDFALAAEGAMVQWRFSPALQGQRMIPCRMRYRVSFQPQEIPVGVRELGRRMRDGDNSGIVAGRLLDLPPKLIRRMDPLANADEDLKPGDKHRATINCVVTDAGVLELPRVLSSSDPLSGYIASAAVSYWHFKPGQRNGKPVTVSVSLPLNF